MRELTLAAGVSEKKYDKLVAGLDRRRVDTLRTYYSWLSAVRAGAYQAVLEIWRLLPPEIWNRYDEWGEEGLREQVLLDERRLTLRKVWNAAKPSTKQKVHPAGPDEGDLRPEVSGADEDRGRDGDPLVLRAEGRGVDHGSEAGARGQGGEADAGDEPPGAGGPAGGGE